MSEDDLSTLIQALYLLSALLFIVGLKRLSKVRSARSGNALAAGAMLLAVITTLVETATIDPMWIVSGLLAGSLIGGLAARRVAMTSMPEMVALLNGSGGVASALIALSTYGANRPGEEALTAMDGGWTAAISLLLSIFIGTLTLSGSVIAFLKLSGRLRGGKAILLPARHGINLGVTIAAIGLCVWMLGSGATHPYALEIMGGITGLSLLLGILLVIPIGGADMPVVVSLLNSYSGLAASAAGFVVGSPLLIIAGAMVGAAGLILTEIMCQAMNRSLLNVLVGGFGEVGSEGGSQEYTTVKSCGPEEAAMLLDAASSVVIVPGYGLAQAQAQHSARELTELLESRGCRVRYGIHPVAGRMPGHMNVLLAEADLPYESLVELEAINPEMESTDAVIVLGANDVVNPAALDNPQSPIYGMPIIEAHKARTVLILKRSLSPGYAGIKNELFEYDQSMMVFGDAKEMLQGMIRELKDL